MSVSAPHSKMPSPALSPARSPRISTDRERIAPHRPPGIINMGMTCFLNSTFQALSASPPLISLLANNPALPLVPEDNTLLPSPVQEPSKTPCLNGSALEPPLYDLLPVTRAFTSSLNKAWMLKDNGGGTAGPREASTQHAITLSPLLRALARKYDQYDEFSQQDAHELLRHLLDSMEMEEKDVVKKLVQAPVAPSEAGGVSGEAAKPSSLTDQVRDRKDGQKDKDELVPFVDALFGGQLASVVVCETCRSVSHTYEGFLDLSLSMRGDDTTPRARKRDRFRAMASKLKPRSPSSRLAAQSAESSAVMSDPEVSDTERRGGFRQGHSTTTSGRKSEPDNDGNRSALGQGLLSRSASSLKTRPSFAFRRKVSSRSVSSKNENTGTLDPVLSNGTADHTPSAGTDTPPEPDHTDGTSTPTSAQSANRSATPVNAPNHHHHHHHAAGPTAAQRAYIQRILYGPPGTPESHDPIAKLRAAHANGLSLAPKPDSGLIDSLKAFTSVEVLDGQNAFACRKCWRVKNGYYRRRWEREQRERGEHSGANTPPGLATSSTSDTARDTVSSILSPRVFNPLIARSPLRNLAQLPIFTLDPDTPDVGASTEENSSSGSERRRTVTPGLTGDTSWQTGSVEETGTSVPGHNDDKGMDRFDTVLSTSSTSMSDSIMSSSSSLGPDRLEPPEAVTPRRYSSAPASPVLGDLDDGMSGTTFMSGSSANGMNLYDDSSSDGLSDTDTEDESDRDAELYNQTGTVSARHAHTHSLTQRHRLAREERRRRRQLDRERQSQRAAHHFVLRRAFKRYLIARAPEILVFQIKRFKQSKSAGMYASFTSLQKIEDFVSFPETLDLAPFMAPNRANFKVSNGPNGPHAPYMNWPSPEKEPESEPVMYRLYAVVVHMGTLAGGHYVAYVLVDPERMFRPHGSGPNTRPSVSEAVAEATEEADHVEGDRDKDRAPPRDRRVWCFCSDTQIRLANVSEVLSAKAYMCFYERVKEPLRAPAPPTVKPTPVMPSSGSSSLASSSGTMVSNLSPEASDVASKVTLTSNPASHSGLAGSNPNAPHSVPMVHVSGSPVDSASTALGNLSIGQSDTTDTAGDCKTPTQAAALD